MDGATFLWRSSVHLRRLDSKAEGGQEGGSAGQHQEDEEEQQTAGGGEVDSGHPPSVVHCAPLSCPSPHLQRQQRRHRQRRARLLSRHLHSLSLHFHRMVNHM